jgi:hypothetical protein
MFARAYRAYNVSFANGSGANHCGTYFSDSKNVRFQAAKRESHEVMRARVVGQRVRQRISQQGHWNSGIEVDPICCICQNPLFHGNNDRETTDSNIGYSLKLSFDRAIDRWLRSDFSVIFQSFCLSQKMIDPFRQRLSHRRSIRRWHENDSAASVPSFSNVPYDL